MNAPRCGVISTMKNEAPYIVDWFAHHVVLGFEYFVIATNDCEDTTNEIIDRLGELTGKVERHETILRRGGLQRSALRQSYFLKMLKHPIDWVYICDSDEYLNIFIKDRTIHDLIAAASEECDCIGVPWRTFGPSPSPKMPQDTVTKDCLLAESLDPDKVNKKTIAKFKKTIFRVSDKILTPGVHQPRARKDVTLISEYPGGRSLDCTDLDDRLDSYNFAQVNHYVLRSMESYLVKVDRGRVNHANQVMGIDYWSRFFVCDVQETSIHYYAHEVDLLKNELLADKKLRDLVNQGQKWHRQKIVQMANDPKNIYLILHMLNALSECAQSGDVEGAQ